MLQVSIFQTLQNNLSTVDFSLLLVDIMTIADEVDWQLAQAMRSYTAAAVGTHIRARVLDALAGLGLRVGRTAQSLGGRVPVTTTTERQLLFW